MILLIYNARLEPRNDLAAGSWTNISRTVGDDHLQHFRGTQSIQDFNSKSFFETMKKHRWQRFSSGNRIANAGKIEVAAVWALMGQQRGVVRGYGKEQAWAIALNVRENLFRRGTRGR